MLILAAGGMIPYLSSVPPHLVLRNIWTAPNDHHDHNEEYDHYDNDHHHQVVSLCNRLSRIRLRGSWAGNINIIIDIIDLFLLYHY